MAAAKGVRRQRVNHTVVLHEQAQTQRTVRGTHRAHARHERVLTRAASNFEQRTGAAVGGLHTCPNGRLQREQLMGQLRMMRSRTQHGSEKRTVMHALSLFPAERSCGRSFVELGANDGVSSHTVPLESSLLWRGACIEASRRSFRRLAQNRPLCETVNAAVGARRERRVWQEAGASTNSMLLRPHAGKASGKKRGALARAVETVPIGELLKNTTCCHRRVDWFVLDVEGAEWEVLRSFPFDEITVAVWSIESNRHNRTELHEYMEGKGYSCTDPDHINTVCHLAKEDSE